MVKRSVSHADTILHFHRLGSEEIGLNCTREEPGQFCKPVGGGYVNSLSPCAFKLGISSIGIIVIIYHSGFIQAVSALMSGQTSYYSLIQLFLS